VERRGLVGLLASRVVGGRGAAIDEALGILDERVGGCSVTALFSLCQSMADLESASLILPDCPEQNFLRASIGIKEPCTILYQRYGEGQFSAPTYSTVVPSGSRTRRCIS